MIMVLKNKVMAASVVVIAVILALFFAFRDSGDIVRTQSASSTYSFVVMGDSRGDSSGVNERVMGTLMNNIGELPNQPRFILFCGDMAHGNSSDLPRELERWKRLMGNYTYFPAIGNHERNDTVFSNAFRHLPNEQLSGYQRTAYYFDYGNARFIVLNSNNRDSSGAYVIDAKQRQWLEGLLRNNRNTHAFVMFHVPAYPIGRHYGSSLDANPRERDALWAVLNKYNVTAVLVSHEHNYNRRLIDSSFSSSFNNEIYQITSGGAGAPLSSTAMDTKNVSVGPLAVYHYVAVDVNGKRVSFNVYDINNRLIDSFTVER